MSRILFLLFIVLASVRPVSSQIVIPVPEALLQWKPSGHDACYHWDAKFSMDGRYVVMKDGPKIVVVNTKTKKHQVVHQHPGIVSSWTCPQTGGLFVVSIANRRAYTDSHQAVSTLDGNNARLDYLEEPNDWFAWKITWSIPIFYRGIGIQFVEGSNYVAILEREPHALTKKGVPRGSSVATKNSYVRLFDRRELKAGESLREARIEVPGLVGGLEWMGENLVVVYASEIKGTRDFLVRKAIVGFEEGTLTKEIILCRLNYDRLNRLPRPAIPNGPRTQVATALENPNHPFRDNYKPRTAGVRVFRFRGGPKPGDLDKLVARMQLDPTFYMPINKLGVLDEQISTLGWRTLYSQDPQNRQPFWYLGNPDGLVAIADVVSKHGKYKVLTMEADQITRRTLRIWDIDPGNP